MADPDFCSVSSRGCGWRFGRARPDVCECMSKLVQAAWGPALPTVAGSAAQRLTEAQYAAWKSNSERRSPSSVLCVHAVMTTSVTACGCSERVCSHAPCCTCIEPQQTLPMQRTEAERWYYTCAPLPERRLQGAPSPLAWVAFVRAMPCARTSSRLGPPPAQRGLPGPEQLFGPSLLLGTAVSWTDRAAWLACSRRVGTATSTKRGDALGMKGTVHSRGLAGGNTARAHWQLRRPRTPRSRAGDDNLRFPSSRRTHMRLVRVVPRSKLERILSWRPSPAPDHTGLRAPSFFGAPDGI